MRRRELRRAPVLAVLLVAAASPPATTTISNAPFIAEGVAATADGKPLVSGVLGRNVLVVEARPRPWLRPGAFAPLGALFGMASDRKRNRLWIAEAFGGNLPGQSGPARSGLLEVDLRTGRVLDRHSAPEDGRVRTIGDVALGAGGVFASDSTSGGLYRLDLRTGALALLVQTHLRSPQGLVASADGEALILADYASGLHRIDLATGADTPLSGDGARLRGMDGLARFGGDLIATQNGGSPNRIVRLHLSKDERKVEFVATLAEGPVGLDDLSLGAVIGRRFVFVSHSQWSAVGEDGKLVPTGVAATLSSLGLRNGRQDRDVRN